MSETGHYGKGNSQYKHGVRQGDKMSREYLSWREMRQRCNRPNHPRRERYGGRGITICERWKDFRNFLADMGPRPSGRVLDRINNDGDYEPSNCRWATYAESAANQTHHNQYTKLKPAQPKRKGTK